MYHMMIRAKKYFSGVGLVYMMIVKQMGTRALMIERTRRRILKRRIAREECVKRRRS